MTLTLQFNIWKEKLREDCARNDKLLLFDGLGDYVLDLLWRSGVEPTVQDIIGQAIGTESRS
jgi:hypothetical protein